MAGPMVEASRRAEHTFKYNQASGLYDFARGKEWS